MTQEKPEFLSILISRFVVEKKTEVSQVLMDGVYSEKSPLFLLRGQIWEQVVPPRILTELEFYSMIIWNCQKVNQSNSALKPLSRLHNVPKGAFVWDILIFQAFGTFMFTGESHGPCLNLKTLVNIEGI